MINRINEGSKAPDFELTGSDRKQHKLSDYIGKNVILYFYPKDNTPGCTIEAKGFTELIESFLKKDTVVIGVSRDSLASHDKFIEKLGIPFVLLSDTEDTVCNLYGVIKEKKMFGKVGIGIERTTFVIDPEGTVRKIYRKPKTEGHAQEILDYLSQM